MIEQREKNNGVLRARLSVLGYDLTIRSSWGPTSAGWYIVKKPHSIDTVQTGNLEKIAKWLEGEEAKRKAEEATEVAPTEPDLAGQLQSVPAQVLTLARRAKAMIEKADKAADKAEQFYKSAGLTIQEIKNERPKDWHTIVAEVVGVGRTRAYELLAVASGKSSLEKVRTSTNERQKIHRAKSQDKGSSVMSRTEPEPESLPLPDPDKELSVEDDLEPDEYRQSFLLRAADAMAFAVYSGEIDNEVIDAAERVAVKWKEFARTLKAAAAS